MGHAIAWILSVSIFFLTFKRMLKAFASLLEAVVSVSATARKLVGEWEEWRTLLKR